MLRRILLATCLLSLLLSACGGSAPPTEGQATDFATACDKANDGKRIAVVGYVRFPDSFTGDQSVLLRMYDTNDFSGKPIGVQIDFGTQANQVEPVKDQYSDSDLKVHLSNGQVAQFGAQVKVSGKVYYPIVSQDFDCALENPLVEAAP
jgi:hypothetical protein